MIFQQLTSYKVRRFSPKNILRRFFRESKNSSENGVAM